MYLKYHKLYFNSFEFKNIKIYWKFQLPRFMTKGIIYISILRILAQGKGGI